MSQRCLDRRGKTQLSRWRISQIKHLSYSTWFRLNRREVPLSLIGALLGKHVLLKSCVVFCGKLGTTAWRWGWCSERECPSAIWLKFGVALMTGVWSLGTVVSARLGFLQLGKTQLQLVSPYEPLCLQVQQAGLCAGYSEYTGNIAIAINKVASVFSRLCVKSSRKHGV